ncbi:odorant-binding protein AgamOBP27 [Anopheles sinensis]|uniref:Odorant-binding protein AgamOBP27 n=1 Tax=Anopheles sinensis TaxID=74873 RepID=A0A084WHN0_ANOSI|nr:odorant-binding protein AgamOBP27 [Anopheles sinensis]
MARFSLLSVLSIALTTISLLAPICHGQDILGSYFRCRNEFDIEPSVFDALRVGNFSVRNSFVECFGECFVKRAGFMNDDFTFNRDTITRFTNRFVSKENSELVYERCTADVTPTFCVTAFDVYQCIYEHIYEKWNTRK